MKILQYIKQDPFIPGAFLEKFQCEMIQLMHDPFSNKFSNKNSEIPLIAFSLNAPLPHSYQVKNEHGNTVVRANPILQKADAHFIAGLKSELVKQPYQHLAIQTADCLPVIFYYQDQTYFIGAITHAGWRGLTSGIIGNTIQKLKEEAQNLKISATSFMEKLTVIMGPAIFGASYECKQDVNEALFQYKRSFQQQTPEYGQLFDICANVRNSPKPSIFPDIQLLGALECIQLGVDSKKFALFRENTYGHNVLPSYRESAHNAISLTNRLWTHLCLPSLNFSC